MKPAIKLTLVSLLAISLILLTVGLFKIYIELKQPMFSKGDPVVIEIKHNSTATSLIDTLYAKQFIHSKSILLNYIKFHSLAHRLKAGYYQISAGDSAETLISKIVNGDVMSATFRIIEGSTLHQVEAKISTSPYLAYKPVNWSTIIGSNTTAEGLLLADTYYYLAGSEAQKLLETANKNLEDYLLKAWQSRDKTLPYKKAYDLLIVASILEKESSLPEERRIISGIIMNRLAINMPLQMDPTVIYSLGANYKGKLSHADLSNDSPYNTYRYRGLPPTPIAMVGKISIDAAANPKHSNFLYFVAKGDGSHIFSETYTEQREAISRYLLKGS